MFLNYAHWYQQYAVPDVDPTYVQLLATDGKGFHLELTDGRTVKANKVVVAVGIASFTYTPDFAPNLPVTVASHTSAHSHLTRFNVHNVAIVGTAHTSFEYPA